MQIQEILLLLVIVAILGGLIWYLGFRYLNFVNNKYVLNKMNSYNLGKVSRNAEKYFEELGIKLSDFFVQADSESLSKKYYYRGSVKEHIIEVNAAYSDFGCESNWTNRRNVRYSYSIFYPKASEKRFYYAINRNLLEKLFSTPLFFFLKKVMLFSDNREIFAKDRQIAEIFIKPKVVQMMNAVEKMYQEPLNLNINNKRVCVKLRDYKNMNKLKLKMLVDLTELIGKELGYFK